MLMQNPSAGIVWKTEILRQQYISGRRRKRINEREASSWIHSLVPIVSATSNAVDQFPTVTYNRNRWRNILHLRICIDVLFLLTLHKISSTDTQHNKNLRNFSWCKILRYVVDSAISISVIEQNGQALIIKFQLSELHSYFGISSSSRLNCAICSILVPVAVSTVRALYAGTLVTCWTTAPSHRPCRSSSALLAALFATLTITARCYASSSATHPLVQLNPRPPRPIKLDSNVQPQHSSKIVLSRLLRIPRNIVQSDTRIISPNSKKSLYNQTFNVVAHFRRNRELQTNPSPLKPRQSKTYSEENYNTQEDDPKIRTNEIPEYPTNSDLHSKHFHILNLEDSDADIAQQDLTFDKRSDSPSVLVNNSESTNVSRVNTVQVEHQNDEHRPALDSGDFERPMPPAHGHSSNSSVNEWGVLVLVLSAVVLTVALGLVTCVLSHYHRSGAGGTAALDPHDAAQTPTTAPMLSVVSAGAAAGVGGMDRLRGRGARELAASRDRQVRMHTVHTDIAIDLPPSIAMPDGEEHAFTSSRLHIRDSEQESEILQKCIRPPPNRTVLESESPPPYRSSSAGLLGSIGGSSSGSSDWSGGSAPLVVRCHSMSSTSKRPEAGTSGQKTDFIQRTVKKFTGKKSQQPTAPTLPVVIVPSRPRRTSDQQQNSTGRPSKPSV